MTHLSKLAAEVMADVEQGELVKQAEVAYTKAELQTDTGKLLQKVAERLRAVSSAQITYNDLARFRKTYDV